MKIEEVDEMLERFGDAISKSHKMLALAIGEQAIQALRAEAWHPIEKAAELGAHTGEIAVLGYGDWGGQNEWFPMIWEGKFWTSSGDFVNPTHFRFINPPEN